MKSIAQFNRVPAHTLYRQYKEFSSGFRDWEQARHAEEYMLFEENIGPDLGIDEVTLSRGELYTYVTNKAAKGGKGSIVASIKGTRSEDIQAVLDRIPADKREQVEQISLDMAKNIESAVSRSFPNAIRVTDRFHVVRLVLEPVQQLRVKLRWQEMDAENKAIKQARKAGVAYKAERLDNGDTPKQLLARCRHALFKPEEKWTKNQWLRVYFAFERYPELKRAYEHAHKLIRMYRLISTE